MGLRERAINLSKNSIYHYFSLSSPFASSSRAMLTWPRDVTSVLLSIDSLEDSPRLKFRDSDGLSAASDVSAADVDVSAADVGCLWEHLEQDSPGKHLQVGPLLSMTKKLTDDSSPV